MSNYDGSAECAAILARVKTLFGGRVGEEILTPPAVSDGSFKPYLIIQFGEPIPAGRGRSLGRETVQPHILPVLAMVVAPNSQMAREGAASVRNRLLDWEPAVGNAGPLTGGTGAPYPVQNLAGATIRIERVLRFECLINLSPVTQ